MSWRWFGWPLASRGCGNGDDSCDSLLSCLYGIGGVRRDQEELETKKAPMPHFETWELFLCYGRCFLNESPHQLPGQVASHYVITESLYLSELG